MEFKRPKKEILKAPWNDNIWPPKCWSWAWNNMPKPNNTWLANERIKYHESHEKECPHKEYHV